MSIAGRLIVFGLVNLVALVALLSKLMDMGNTYPRALRMAWNLVILNNDQENDRKASPEMAWFTVLRKTWWLNIVFCCLCWILNAGWELSVMLAVLVLVHVYWFQHGKMSLEESYDQVYCLNANWGVVYQEIKKDTEMNGRSLAELDLRKKNLLVLAVQRNGQVLPFPKGLEILGAGDRVVMFGDLNAYRGLGG
jgi:hypothetical protein